MQELFDKFREECGLMAVWGHREASNLSYLGLYAQQHRGQEGAGIVALNRHSKHFSMHRGLGLVQEVFERFDFSQLPGDCALGHVRYTTAGGHLLANVQPFFAELSIGHVALAHNGNLINADQLRAELIKEGAIFSATSDTEVILHLLSRNKVATAPLVETVIGTLKRIKGAYSLIMMFNDRLYAVRDAHGVRPLALGTLDGVPVIASETCAFDLIGASYVRDIEPGELLEISGNGEMKSYRPFDAVQEAACIFEYVYFSRPDSNVFGRNVYPVRKRMGVELAREHPCKADFVVPVPDSGVTSALGYAEAAGLPLELGLIRNHYVGRTFIEPKQSIRDFGVKIKLNANPEILTGKSIVVVDDSIVRGTTSRKLVQMLRGAGAREVHMRISSPPTTDPCYYGIDTPEKSELIAAHKTSAEIASYLGVDSLGYLSVEGLYRAVQGDSKTACKGKFCDACFTSKYPLGTSHDFEDRQKKLL